MKTKTLLKTSPSFESGIDSRSESERIITDAVQRAHLRSNAAFLPLDADAAARGAGIRRAVDAAGICTLTFDRPASPANVLDRESLLEFEEHLNFVARSPNIRGVIIASAKPNIFIAGADLNALAGMADQAGAAPASDLNDLIALGQHAFNQLTSLEIPTLAAIHGACLGGGCELALACDYRIATDDSSTKIGLPETQLGIIPAWGGCTRLPRLIGLRRATAFVLAGKPVNARRAMALGLVNEAVPVERLFEVARKRMAEIEISHHPRLRRAWLGPAALALRTIMERQLAIKTRGNYPALFEALEVMTHGMTRTVRESLDLERAAILRLAQTSACRNLIRMFFQRERARKARVAPATLSILESAAVAPLSNCAVVGAGVMGSGIAQWLSSRGLKVVLRDVNLQQLAHGMSAISKLYDAGVKRGSFTPLQARAGLDRIFPAATDVPLRNVELVIEAATEKIELKRDIFRSLSAQTPPETLLATNTSALSLNELAAVTKHPGRVVGLHFFNPVHRMELVEVVAGKCTSAETLARAVRFTQQIGKIPVVVRDSPGFVVNRVLMPYLIEAAGLFANHVPAHDIDEAMLDFGMPMGPLRLLDEVGIDVAFHVAETLARHFPDRVALPASLIQMVREGKLGKKSGHGFYVHRDGAAHLPVGLERHTHMDRDALQQRMALLMVNEAARCVEEGVASAADVDLALVLGAGFAPFRGGPLRYGDAIGLRAVASALHHLAERDAKFLPCALIEELAAANGTFHEKEVV